MSFEELANEADRLYGLASDCQTRKLWRVALNAIASALEEEFDPPLNRAEYDRTLARMERMVASHAWDAEAGHDPWAIRDDATRERELDRRYEHVLRSRLWRRAAGLYRQLYEN